MLHVGWSHQARTPRRITVYPDGCRDAFTKSTCRPPISGAVSAGRAARPAALSVDLPLAAVAVSLGYSDQAHMTRDCLNWFGQSPARLRRDHAARAILAQPGLGNWTGVQISMR